MPDGFACPAAYSSQTGISITSPTYPDASPHGIICGSGILTGFPSTTAFALALGPTNPEQINLTQETLGFRCAGFSPALSLLMPTKSFPIASLKAQALRLGRPFRYRFTATECSPTMSKDIQSFGGGFSPVELSVQSCLTSELLRFL